MKESSKSYKEKRSARRKGAGPKIPSLSKDEFEQALKKVSRKLSRTQGRRKGQITMNKNVIWISFELGLRGDYESLFQFLDTHKARECGDNLAVMSYECKQDLLTELQTITHRSAPICIGLHQNR